MTDTITLPRDVALRLKEAMQERITRAAPIPFQQDVVAFTVLAIALAEPKPITVAKTERKPRITCGFVDVLFDGEGWFCAKCNERMPANYEALVERECGARDFLALMQRKHEGIRARGSK